jgi:hypothetical protein
MTDLLIPFGISNRTNKIIEPDDAERGRACDCRCPGCDTPLLSRHPKDERMRIHFAHDSRHPEAVSSVIEECPFNSQLAIALMARHVAEQLSGALIRLPAMYTSVSYGDCIHEGYVKVTNETDLTIDNAFIEVDKFGSTFDLKLQFGDHRILVWLKYNDRPVPLLTENDKSELGSVGVLCIDIDTFDQKSFATEKKRFSKAVIEFLLSSGQREWIYHPKTKLVIEAEKQKHNCSWESSVTRARRDIETSDEFDLIDEAVVSFSRNTPKPPEAPKPAPYQCVMCKAKWTHAVPGSPECPRGCGHLYARKLG